MPVRRVGTPPQPSCAFAPPPAAASLSSSRLQSYPCRRLRRALFASPDSIGTCFSCRPHATWVSPLESALTKNVPVTPVESALTKTLDLKCRLFILLQKPPPAYPPSSSPIARC